MEKFFSWGELEGKTLKERLLKILFFISMTVFCITALLFLICYFLCGLFILDGIYYVITGKTVVWEHINI
jgi:hypothetical protein